MKTIALIDGDIFAYELAAASEEPTYWGDGLWTLHAFEDKAVARLDSRLVEIAHSIGADDLVVCLSSDTNWRNSVLPSYKHNRAAVRRPMLLPVLKEHLKENYDTRIIENLEADDVLGILSTTDDGNKKIIVTKDKDLKTIPGFIYMVHEDKPKVVEVTEEEADRWHMIQTLSGDVTDGYSGCPGIGTETAKAIVDDPFIWEYYEYTFKSGKRKGQTEGRYRRLDAECSVWDAVVSTYEKAGLSEEYALPQAQVARILRATDYKNGEVKLWMPH